MRLQEKYSIWIHAKYGRGNLIQKRRSGSELLVKFEDGLSRWVTSDEIEVYRVQSASVAPALNAKSASHAGLTSDEGTETKSWQKALGKAEEKTHSPMFTTDILGKNLNSTKIVLPAISKERDINPTVENNSTQNEIAERCYWLGITNPYQVAIIAALSVKPSKIGKTEEVIREAAGSIDPDHRKETLSKIEEAAEFLVSHNFVKLIESSRVYLFFINPKFWARQLSEIQFETLIIHEILEGCKELALQSDAFIEEIKGHFEYRFAYSPLSESIFLHLKALSNQSATDCIKLIPDKNGARGSWKVIWKGNPDTLSKKVSELSKLIPITLLDAKRDENYLASPESSNLPVNMAVENIMKNSERILHYEEIEEKIEEKHRNRYTLSVAANYNRNIIEILPGVFVHRDHFDEDFKKSFERERDLILEFVKKYTEREPDPVSIEYLVNFLFDSVVFERFSKKSISSAITSYPQMNPDFLIIPSLENPKKLKIVRKSINCPEKQSADASLITQPLVNKNAAHIFPKEEQKSKESVSKKRLSPEIKKLLELERPQDHIDPRIWHFWIQNLAKSAFSNFRIADIASPLRLNWPYSRREETLSEYLHLDLKQICRLPGFGNKKLRSLVLCVADCASQAGFFDERKQNKKEGTRASQTPGQGVSIAQSSVLGAIIGEDQGYGDSSNKSDKLNLKRLVHRSRLSVRAKNVISRNVFSVQELVDLDYSKVLSFKYCGRKAASEIVDFIKQIKHDDAAIGQYPQQPLAYFKSPIHTLEQKTKNFLASRPTKDSLEGLPIFSSKPLNFISEEDLHPDFKANLKLSEVVMSVRTSKALRKVGYASLGQLLLIPGVELLSKKNFGRKSLKELQSLIRELILPETNADYEDKIRYSSYPEMLIRLTGACRMVQRDRKILLMRLLPSGKKLVTLEKIAETYSLTRERIRQILLKGFRQIRHPARRKILNEFWNKIDEITDSGGGLIYLEQLATLLENELQWNKPVNPIALKELLVQLGPEDLFENKKKGRLILAECECLGCYVPSQSLSDIFTPDDSVKMNIWVVCEKIINACHEKCTRRSVPVKRFHRAFLERVIDTAQQSFVLQGDLVFPEEQWEIIHGKNLFRIVYISLKNYGAPLHFREIAKIIRKVSENYSCVSDDYVRNVLISRKDFQPYDRGKFGLSSWSVSKYRPASKAIEELFEGSELPMKRQEIIAQINGEYKERNICAALGYPKFHRIGEGYYDLSERWSKRTCDNFIAMLSEPGSSFARYVVTNNNFSYKLVMALVFLRGMDESGSFPLHILKDRFINFYLARQKRGQIVESESASVSRIGELGLGVIRDRSVRRPLESFVNSGFFSKEMSTLWLRGDLVNMLADNDIKGIVVLTILRGIDDYFARIEISESYKQRPVEHPPKTGEGRVPFSKNSWKKTKDGHWDSAPSITIKRKTKGRIRL